MALARSLLAMGSLGTLISNPAALILAPAAGCGHVRLTLFCLVPPSLVPAAMVLAALFLMWVIIGVDPRVSGVLHWWVAFSLYNSLAGADGGDRLASNLTFWLLPVALLDPRKNHWFGPAPESSMTPKWTKRLARVANGALFVARCQVGLVYAMSVAAKLRLQEWRDGTAIYYYVTDASGGAIGLVRTVLQHLMDVRFILLMLTWGTLAFESLILFGPLMPRNPRRILFSAAAVFHIGLAAVFGIPSFSLIMVGALLIYLQPQKADNADRQPTRATALVARWWHLVAIRPGEHARSSRSS
jgi:antimicrobial peptide system SdpB family protein